MMGFLQQLGSWQNVVAGNGMAISAVGMIIVFAALGIICLAVAGVPHILSVVNRVFPEAVVTAPVKVPSAGVTEEIIAAISLALHHSR